MTIKEKLNYFREKIGGATQFNTDFKNLIGIELFDFIHSNNLLKAEFERRHNYLKNLADDTGFNSIQDNLFETIQRILKLTSLKEAQEQQKVWGNALFNRLKNSTKREERVPDTLTLPEIYVALQDKNNYYRLKDNSYYSPFDGEISLDNHIVPVKKQYEVIVENFFREIFLSKSISDKKKSSHFKSLINEYNNYWYKFDELIYRIPVKLHFKSFENFFSDCTEFCIREGYEFHYNFFANSNSRNTETRLIKVKKDAFIVIDDLIEFSETESEQVSKKPNSNHSDKGKIEKITIIELKNGRHSVAVNDNYNETREIKDNSESWQIFIKEIEDKNIRPENRTGVKDISVSMRDYFNYNENCPIYMSGKYTLTEIIIGRDIRKISPEIKTKIITQKQLLSLQKRKAKKLKAT